MRPSWFLYLYSLRNESQMNKTSVVRQILLVYEEWCTSRLRQIYCKIDELSLSRVSQYQFGSQSNSELKNSNGKPAETGENNQQRSSEIDCINGLRQHYSRTPSVSLRVNAKVSTGSGGCPTWSY